VLLCIYNSQVVFQELFSSFFSFSTIIFAQCRQFVAWFLVRVSSKDQSQMTFVSEKLISAYGTLPLLTCCSRPTQWIFMCVPLPVSLSLAL